MSETLITVIITALVFSAFFSGIEIAFVSCTKLVFELKKKNGSVPGAIISGFYDQPSKFISTTLVGNTLALVVYGTYMAKLLKPYLLDSLPENFDAEITILILETLISTLLVLAIAEFLPKSTFLINAEGILMFLAIPIKIIYYITYPLTYFIFNISKGIIKGVLKLPYSEDKPAFGLTDLDHYIQNLTQKNKQEDEKPEFDTQFISNALEFKKLKIRDCMIPRTDIQAMDINDGLEALKKMFIQTGHTRIILYNERIDQVVGYAHSSSMFRKPDEMDEVIKEIPFVPETLPANELMVEFIQKKKNIAIVVDEYGGTSGLVTIEDVMEEIFGEINDEYDAIDITIEKMQDDYYKVSARAEIDYLNERISLDIPEGDYDTLGGYILHHNSDIPSVGEVLSMEDFEIKILEMEEARIDLVSIRKVEKAD